MSSGRVAAKARALAREVFMRTWSAPRFGVSRFGSGCRIANSCIIRRGSLEMGMGSFVGPQCFIQVPTRLGNHVMLAARVAAVGGNHRMDLVGTPMSLSGREHSDPVIVEDDVWVGYGAIMLAGARIGRGSVVAAGAVVVGAIPDGVVVGGIPARVIRRRFASEADEAWHWTCLEQPRRHD